MKPVKREKPLKIQKDVKLDKASHCSSCGKLLSGATAVTPSVSNRVRKVMPKPGDMTVCIVCGHLMAFGDDLGLRELTDAEALKVAGDRRILAIQRARGGFPKEMKQRLKESGDADRVARVSGGDPGGDPGHGAPESLPSGGAGANRERKD